MHDMNIKIKEYTTEVSGMTSLSELLDSELGSPCLLIVKNSKITGDISNDIRDFFTKASFLSYMLWIRTIKTISVWI